jgi:hypothetical protein
MAAMFLLGCWLTGTIAMAIVATQNFYTIDRLLQAQPNPQFNKDVQQLGAEESRQLLRYLSSELNRLYFQYWNFAEVAIGIAVLWLVVMLPEADKVKWYVLGMLSIVLFLTWVITPQVVSVGRALDFVPRNPPPPDLRTFGLLHAAFTVLDLTMLILGIIVIRSLWKGASSEKLH